jgi:hypothetical protein
MKKTHLSYGAVTAIIMIVISVVLYMTGNSFTSWAKYAILTPYLIGILLNAVAFSKANDHFVTFGNVFGSGFGATAIVTIIMILWSFISLVIFPEMKSKGLDLAHAEMVKQGLSDDVIDQRIKFASDHFILFMVMGAIFLYVFTGVIFSLIGGAIAKKKGNNPFENTQNVS